MTHHAMPETFTIELTMTRLVEVDRFAQWHGLTRSEAIVTLVNEALSHWDAER